MWLKQIKQIISNIQFKYSTKLNEKEKEFCFLTKDMISKLDKKQIHNSIKGNSFSTQLLRNLF